MPLEPACPDFSRMGKSLKASTLGSVGGFLVANVFMTMAGYDPNEATAFWSRMAAAGGGKQAEFLSTHPADEKRIAQLKALIPEALKYKPQE